MNFSLNKDDSLLVINKEELKILEPKRRRSSKINEYFPNEFTPKRENQSMLKFQNLKSNSLNNKRIKIIKAAKQKGIIRHFSSKNIPKKPIKLKRVSYSNKTLNYCSLKTRKIPKKKVEFEIMDLGKEQKSNLKRVENEILTKIKNMKFNYQNNSSLTDEVFMNNNNNNTLDKIKFHNLSLNNSFNNTSKNNTPNNKNIEQIICSINFKNQIEKKFSNKSNNIKNNNILNKSDIIKKKVNNNTNKNINKKKSLKFNTVIMKKDNLKKFQEDIEINKDFLNSTNYDNYSNKELSKIININKRFKETKTSI